MTYIPPERTPRQPRPPIHWKTEDERKRYMARMNEERTPRKPPKPEVSRLYPSSALKNALYEYAKMYGGDDMSNLKYLVSLRVYLALYLELFIYMGKISEANLNEVNRGQLLSFLGFPISADGKLANTSCVLIAGDNEYHFEIPEAPKKKPRPKPSKFQYTRGWPIPPPPDPNITPMWRCNFGAFDFIGRFIDWLRSIPFMVSQVKWTAIASTKPKAKTNGEQMATLAELFDGYPEERERGVDHTIG